MKKFADLYRQLDETNKTSEKTAAMVRYFQAAAPAEAAWALYFLSGRKPRQVVPSRKLQAWALERADVPGWLFAESYDAVGDMAETMALLLLDSHNSSDLPLDRWVEEKLLNLRDLGEADQRREILAAWDVMDVRQRFVWNKLITGSFRVGVSQQLVIRALAEVANLSTDVVAHRLMGEWKPTPEWFQTLFARDVADADISRPYPFFLAHPLEGDPSELGDVRDWQAEWKWDGIRCQLLRRAGSLFLWSRGEELVTDRYPELRAVGETLSDGTVLDGEILAWKGGGVKPFASLQRRIGRKTVGKKMLQDYPVVLMAYDLLEFQGRDLRTEPLIVRRRLLEELIAARPRPALQLSPLIAADSWEVMSKLRQESRGRNVEGIMLKRLDSPYRVGRQRGEWWKWKIEPYALDMVLINAQAGHGKRAGLYTDYTFAVWDQDQLVPIAKAYSGLTDAEIREVDAFVRKNTLEKFGPVRTVKPVLVFELGFEGIQRSTRHKSGVAVRFPRILRWRRDKPIAEADTLENVRALLADRQAPAPAALSLFDYEE